MFDSCYLPGLKCLSVSIVICLPLPALPGITCQLFSLILLLLKIFLTTLGMAFVLSVPNREYNFVRVCPNNKVLPVYVWLIWFTWCICPEHGGEAEERYLCYDFSVLNRVRLSTSHLLMYTQILAKYPPPPPPPGGTNQWHVQTLLFDLFLFSGDEVPAHLYGKTEFGDNVDNEWFIVSLLLQLSNVFPETCIRWDNYTLSSIYSSNET